MCCQIPIEEIWTYYAMFPDERVIEVVRRLTGVPVEQIKAQGTPDLRLPDSMDSLDTVELVAELKEEFDEETIRWAVRYIQALTERAEVRRSKRSMLSQPDCPDPLWDRELDG